MRKIKRLILQTERRRQATNHKFKQSSESPAWNLQVVCFVQFTEIFNDRKIRKAKSKCLALDWWLIHYPQYLLIDLFVHSEKSSPSFCLYADSPPTVLVLVSWVFVISTVRQLRTQTTQTVYSIFKEFKESLLADKQTEASSGDAVNCSSFHIW